MNTADTEILKSWKMFSVWVIFHMSCFVYGRMGRLGLCVPTECLSFHGPSAFTLTHRKSVNTIENALALEQRSRKGIIKPGVSSLKRQEIVSCSIDILENVEMLSTRMAYELNTYRSTHTDSLTNDV